MTNTSDYQPGLHRFAVFTAGSTVLLLVAGALVTSNDAGLAVPDWPLSYGSLMPPMVGGIFYEHGHRIIATTVGILTIILAVWLSRREPRRWVRRLGWIALAGVIAQGLLGGLTVMLLLPKAVSIAHATVAQLFFCTLVGIALFTSKWWHTQITPIEESETSPLRNMAAVTCVAILVQLVLGAGFRHGAFGILPHLMGAAVVATLSYRTAAIVRQAYSKVPGIPAPATALAWLITLQLVLGGASLWARMATREFPQPVPWTVTLTVAHVAAGALTFAAAVILALCAFRVLRPAREYALESGEGRATV